MRLLLLRLPLHRTHRAAVAISVLRACNCDAGARSVVTCASASGPERGTSPATAAAAMIGKSLRTELYSHNSSCCRGAPALKEDVP